MINGHIDIKPEKVFLIIGLVFGIAFIFITPPFQVPDEASHYYKSLYLSDGHFIPEQNGYFSGVIIPENAFQLSSKFIKVGANTENNIKPSNLTSLIDDPLNNNDKIFCCMSSLLIINYSPIPYLASTFFIIIGKLLNCSPIVLMYLGRLANLLLYICIVFYAIKNTPIQKWVFLLLALMPMTLYEAASLSADSFTIAISILTIAIFFKIAFDPRKKIVNNMDISILLILAMLIGLSKQIYLLFLLLFFLIPSHKFKTKKNRIKSFIFIFLPVILITYLWSLFSSGFYVPISGISILGQISFILSNPILFLQIFLNSLVNYYIWYLVSFVGYFGWLSTPLPVTLVYLYIIFLILASLMDEQKDTLNIMVTLKQKFISLAIFIITLISIYVLEYITWTSVGNNIIEGVQGRYFIPIAPLFLFLFYNNKIKVNRKEFYWVCIMFLVITLSISLEIIIERFYII
jgi:uncharacterized membrane protein